MIRVYLSSLILQPDGPEPTARWPAWMEALGSPPWPIRVKARNDSQVNNFNIVQIDTDNIQHAALLANSNVEYVQDNLIDRLSNLSLPDQASLRGQLQNIPIPDQAWDMVADYLNDLGPWNP